MTLHNSININSFTGIVKNSSSTGILTAATPGVDYYSPGNPTYLIDDFNPANSYANFGAGIEVLNSLVLGSATNTLNTVIGQTALYSFTTGANNAFFGFGSGYFMISGSQNTVFGINAFSNVVSGSNNNTVLGYNAAQNQNTYNSCLFLGYCADASVNSLTNAISIGASSVVSTSNTIILGNTSITKCNIPGISFGFTANTITSTNTNGNIVLTPNGTGIISLSNSVGLGTTTANSALQFANALNYRTITLYESTNNSYQYYGFGIQPNVLVYNVYGPSAIHGFYAGTSSSASQELMRITATGTTSNSGCIGINVGATPSAACHVIGGVQNVTNEDTCFRAESSSNCAKMEFNCTAAGGRLYEIRSTNTGNLEIVDRTGSAEKLIINTTGVGISGTPSYLLDVSGTTRVRKFLGTTGQVPTYVLGSTTVVGVGAIASIVGSEIGGIFTLNTGTGVLVSGVIATFTLAAAMPSSTFSIVFFAENSAGVTGVYASPTSSSTFTLSLTGTLGVSTTFKWSYQIVGY